MEDEKDPLGIKNSDPLGIKKKDNLESSGPVPQEVSTTLPSPKKSLLGTENQKKPSDWGTLVGKPKDVTIGGFKINKQPIVGVKPKSVVKATPTPNVDFSKMNVDQLIDFDKGNEVSYVAPTVLSAMAGGVSKSKMSPQLRPQFDSFIKQNYESAVQKTKPYALKKEDLTSIEDDYKEAQSGGSLLYKVGAYTKGILNYQPLKEDNAGLKIKTPLEDLRKEVRDEAIHNGETLLPGQVEYRVKQKFIEEKKAEIHQSKMNAAKENLTPAEQYSLGLHKAQQASHLSKENKDNVKNMSEITSSIDGMTQDAESMKKEYDRLGGKVSQEFVDKFEDIKHNIALNLELRKTYQTKYVKNQKDIGTFQQEASAYTSENNEMLDIAKRIKSYGYGALGNLHEFTSKYIDKPSEAAFNTLGDITGIPLLKGMGMAAKHYGDVDQQYSEEYAKKAQKIKEGREGVVPGVIVGGTTKTLGLHNANDYANELVSIVGDNAGMTAALLAGGTAGLVATAVESAGGKVAEIRRENEGFKKAKEEAIANNENNFEFNGEKYKTKEYANKDLHSDVASYVVPIAWGGTMVLPMARQLKFLQNESRIAAAIEKESPDLLQKTFMQKTKDWTKDYIGHSLGLARDLKIMSLGQATLDDALGKKVDYFKVASDLKSVRDAFILHGMNAGFAHALGQTSRPYMTNEEAKTIDNNSRLISDLNNRLRFENITPESKVLVKKQIDRLTAESNVHIDNVLDRMSNMNDADYSKVVELARKSSDLRQEATDIHNSEFLNEEKQFALDKVKEDYIKNEKVLKGIKENYTPRKDGFFALPDREQNKLKEEASKKLISEAKARGDKEFNFSDRDITMEASKIHDSRNVPKEEVATPTEEKNVFYYKNEAPSEVPEGYTTMKKVENSAEIKLFEEQEAKPKGIEDVISKPIEIDINTNKSKENKPNTTIEEKKAEVEKLREEEQNEYKDVSPDDKVKLGEIYNKYDKLISPLLREIKAEGKPTEEAKPTEEFKVEEPTPTKSRKNPKTKLEEETTPKVETEKEKEKVSLPTEAVDKMNELLKDKKQQQAILKKLIAEGRIEEKPCNI